ncbi:response receiver sensor histidine kinase, GAF and PAS domain-containing [Geotalea daltonii FRC-32]|uniref:histidine kinase n=1 Tax=Geotalea daltonii (strain DSM 22248 / JCM 15807 / FRC-32) TaxID=316067 RepID=B9M874_GEODF|nr:ATP-binding protein [Geotalea daltonii]ACM20340.1 response receiver sensor histidine kinase, GAF and PAS domain-containing [Geotalea daltonii FRC-32]
MKATKILIVDDQKYARQMLRDILAPLQFVIEEAGDGREAVMKTMDFRPDIILMDLMMPDMSGIEASRLIKSDLQTASIPILVITASKEKNNLLSAFAEGVDDYITKPFSTNELLARVQANLYKRDALILVEQKKTDAGIILDLSLSIASTLNAAKILQIIVARIAEHVNMRRCSIVRFSDSSHGHVLASNDDPSAKGLRIELSRYPELQEMIRTGKAFVVKDAKRHPLLAEVREYIEDIDFDTILVIPIHHEQEIIGALILRTKGGENSFGSRELAFCQSIADAAANAIKNASLFEKVLEESDELRETKEKLEKELREKTVYEGLFEHASEGLMVLNAAGQPQYVNRSAAEMLGYSGKQMLKMSLKDFLAEESLQVGMENHINFFLGREFSRKYDVLFKTSSGEKRCVAVSVSNHRLEGNYAILALIDVTRERRDQHLLAEANERLKALDLLKSEFIYTATNDLRLPVAVLHSNCLQLRESDTENLTETQCEHLDAAIESCDRLMDLIEELLDSSRFDLKDYALTIGKQNIMDPIREVYTVLAPFASGNGVQMTVTSLQSDIFGSFDGDKIKCVLTNLIGNAIKFTPRGGEIGISVDADDLELKISISDTGEGIPEAYVTRIFNEFYHLKSAKGSLKKGSGLGLAVSKRIIDAHNGRIWVESSEDRGTTFSFAIPLTR